MNIAVESEARVALKPVAPPNTKPLGAIFDRPAVMTGPVPAPIGLAVGVVLFLVGLLVFTQNSGAITFLAMAPGAALIGLVVVKATERAKTRWGGWWSLYAASHEAADVSPIVIDAPVPAWFEIDEDNNVVFTFPTNSSAVRDARTRHRTQQAVQRAWQTHAENGMSALTRWQSATVLLCWLAPTTDPDTQRELWEQNLTWNIHTAAGHDLEYTHQFIDVSVQGQSGNVRAVTMRSTTTVEVCPSYQRENFQHAVQALLQPKPGQQMFWNWDNPLEVSVEILSTDDPGAQQYQYAASLRASIEEKLGYRRFEKIKNIAVTGWEQGPTQVQILLQDVHSPAQIRKTLSVDIRMLLTQSFPGRAWYAGQVSNTTHGTSMIYQAISPASPQAQTALTETRAENVVSQLLGYDDSANLESSQTTADQTQLIFTLDAENFAQTYWRENFEEQVKQILPGSVVHWDLPNQRVAFTLQ